LFIQKFVKASIFISWFAAQPSSSSSKKWSRSKKEERETGEED
jgi:hypothetical protein